MRFAVDRSRLEVSLGDIATPQIDRSGPTESPFFYVDISSVDRETKRISDAKSLEAKTAPSRAKQRLRVGDVLVSMTRPNLNAVAMVSSEFDGAIGSTGFHVLRTEFVEPKFLFYLVQTRAFIEAMSACVQGALYPAVRPKDIESFKFFLPSSAVQHRIVAKIEELFSELDQGVASLKTAREQLKVYRQSLLKNAFEGKLTAAWRAAHRDQLETATALQQRIARERQARHQQQLADWQTAGQQGPKPKPPKPLPPLTTEELAELPELPEGWGWVKLGEFIESIDAGKSFKCDEREPSPTEIGVAKVSAVTWGEYDESESKTCTDANKENEAYFIRQGDFLLSRANTIDLVGACVIAKRVTKKVMLSDKTLRIRFDGFSEDFFLQYLRCRIGRRQIMALSTGNQESMRNIGQERIRSIAVPICSEIEARVLLEELESKLSEADQLDQTLATALQQADALRQSILKKAFHGQLVKQAKNEEPATALLERIRAGKSNGMEMAGKRGKAG